MSNFTLEVAITTASTWTRTANGITLTAAKTTFVEVDALIRQTTGGYSSSFKKTIGIEYVSGAFQVLGFAAGTTTASGLTLASDSNLTYGATDDVQFVISSGALYIEFMSAAAASCKAFARTVEV